MVQFRRSDRLLLSCKRRAGIAWIGGFAMQEYWESPAIEANGGYGCCQGGGLPLDGHLYARGSCSTPHLRFH
ncbi:MAG TPA: hypothetical protein QF800_03795, partial [Phycisphaerales bacterium]|nr:hypothetical protein [Phycisphaerales bacterium]